MKHPRESISVVCSKVDIEIFIVHSKFMNFIQGVINEELFAYTNSD